mmetsp:Transcript_55820/g.166005  ORF Transcript_55820/g.166005 Transcript_55820/m.166005 type:complete len:205 (+) Transcript_55820:177-791(+)
MSAALPSYPCYAIRFPFRVRKKVVLGRLLHDAHPLLDKVEEPLEPVLRVRLTRGRLRLDERRVRLLPALPVGRRPRRVRERLVPRVAPRRQPALEVAHVAQPVRVLHLAPLELWPPQLERAHQVVVDLGDCALEPVVVEAVLLGEALGVGGPPRLRLDRALHPHAARLLVPDVGVVPRDDAREARLVLLGAPRLLGSLALEARL